MGMRLLTVPLVLGLVVAGCGQAPGGGGAGPTVTATAGVAGPTAAPPAARQPAQQSLLVTILQAGNPDGQPFLVVCVGRPGGPRPARESSSCPPGSLTRADGVACTLRPSFAGWKRSATASQARPASGTPVALPSGDGRFGSPASYRLDAGARWTFAVTRSEERRVGKEC